MNHGENMGDFENLEEEKNRTMRNLALAVEKAKSIEPIIKGILEDLRAARCIPGDVSGGVIQTVPTYGFCWVHVAEWRIGEECVVRDEYGYGSETGLQVLASFTRPFENYLYLRVGACGELKTFGDYTENLILQRTGGDAQYAYRRYTL